MTVLCDALTRCQLGRRQADGLAHAASASIWMGHGLTAVRAIPVSLAVENVSEESAIAAETSIHRIVHEFEAASSSICSVGPFGSGLTVLLEVRYPHRTRRMVHDVVTHTA